MSKMVRGQWKGSTPRGSYVIANMNSENERLSGNVAIYESFQLKDAQVSLWFWSSIKGTVDEEGIIIGELFGTTVHHGADGELLNEQECNFLFNEQKFEIPTKSEFSGSMTSSHRIRITSRSSYNSYPERKEIFVLQKEKNCESKIPATELSWNDFKSYALNQAEGVIFRGQAGSWKLTTSYHRTGYADLNAYLDNMVPELERHINSHSNHPYNMNDDRSLGALLNLAQHHGYPTPLLDWSKSPYVAAFFAFEDEEKLKKDGHVSIFVFNEKAWAQRAGRMARIRSPKMMVRTLELPGFGNPRVLPQQSITMYSNVADIEGLIHSNESTPGEFLTRITIPAKERDLAIRDLGLMGITWGSMFPGYDGICKQLASRHFKG
jgi:hypothetical protein